MKIEISNKHLLIFGLTITVLLGGGYLVSPLSVFAKQTILFCANRDGLTAAKFENLNNDMNRIKELAAPLAEFDWQNDGTAFIQIMVVINSQLGEFESKITQKKSDLNAAEPCKNNEDYLRVTQKMVWALNHLEKNLKVASGYQLYNFPLYASNASKMLTHISDYESAYTEFFTPKT